MRTIRLVTFVVITLAVGLACKRAPTNGPAQTPPSTTASPQTGITADEFAATRAIFKEHGVTCHGDNAAGGRVQVEAREIKVPNLTGEHARKPTDERISAKISEGPTRCRRSRTN